MIEFPVPERNRSILSPYNQQFLGCGENSLNEFCYVDTAKIGSQAS